MSRDRDPIPLTLVAGFLGSGKTTLVNRVLTERHGERIAVIVNEFGEVGIDGRLVETVDENIVELTNGCLCCTIRGDLAETIHGLLRRSRRRWAGRARFERLLVEASGMASPGPVAQTLEIVPELAGLVELDGIVTLAHAGHIVRQLARHPEAVEQIGYADRIVLNHIDRCSDDEVGRAERAVRAVNGIAELRRARHVRIDVGEILQLRTRRAGSWRLEEGASGPGTCTDPSRETHDARVHGPGGTDHTEGVRTLSLEASRPLDIHRLKMWLRFVAARRVHEIWRLKGMFHCVGLSQAVVAQGIYQWLEFGPADRPPPERSILVLIGRDLDEVELRRGWGLVTGDSG